MAAAAPSTAGGELRPTALSAYLKDSRERVLGEIRAIVPRRTGPGALLYELMLDYPLRGGKALRPALAIAACRSLGGHVEAVLRTAAVLELYHNAFLIHDDVEDGSEKRRNEPTLHRQHGVPIAVNVGDGMLALTMEPLLDNIELVGLGRALRILQVVARMARESAEGQMMELEWIRRADWTPRDRDYLRMVYKKTTWYTFLAPVLVGAIAAGADDAALRALGRFATPLGIAFQIQDDLLNLVGDEARYGKEISGDLWEGKHTLLLIDAVRRASPTERTEALRILAKPRPPQGPGIERSARRGETGDLAALVLDLAATGEISATARDRLCAALAGSSTSDAARYKTGPEIDFLRDLIDWGGSTVYASDIARRHARRAARSFDRLRDTLPASLHLDFLGEVVQFVVERDC